MVKLIFEWLGAFTGLMGSGLIAWNHASYSVFGFWLFLLSNCCWIGFGLKQRAWGLVSMQIGFSITSILGIYNWS